MAHSPTASTTYSATSITIDTPNATAMATTSASDTTITTATITTTTADDTATASSSLPNYSGCILIAWAVVILSNISCCYIFMIMKKNLLYI